MKLSNVLVLVIRLAIVCTLTGLFVGQETERNLHTPLSPPTPISISIYDKTKMVDGASQVGKYLEGTVKLTIEGFDTTYIVHDGHGIIQIPYDFSKIDFTGKDNEREYTIIQNGKVIDEGLLAISDLSITSFIFE